MVVLGRIAIGKRTSRLGQRRTYFWMKDNCPINIQMVMKLTTKTELSRSMGTDLIPRLQRGVIQDPSLKQKTQHHPCAYHVYRNRLQKKRNFFGATVAFT
jgi:hypothetical protein